MTFLLNRTLDQVRKSRETTEKGKSQTNQSNEPWKHDLFEDAERKQLSKQQRSFEIDNSDDTQHHARSTSLLITNLHYDVSEAELEALFSQIGKIDRGPFIKFDQSGRATEGLAFVSYANEVHAEAAMEAFNGASAKGQPIGVKYAFSMPGWVRGVLGISRRSSGAGVTPTFGLLGRIQQERPSGRPHFTPYDLNRPRGSRASFPPGRPNGSSHDQDNRRATDVFGSGIRTRGGSNYRGVSRPRGMGERSTTTRGGVTKSARELDKELEAFMGSTNTNSASSRGANPINAEADVQMAE